MHTAEVTKHPSRLGSGRVPELTHALGTSVARRLDPAPESVKTNAFRLNAQRFPGTP